MNPRLCNWHDCRVWLIGASAGIGAALAVALARRGARLILSARHRDALQAVAATCALPVDGGVSGGLPRTPPLIVPLDVTRPDDVASAWARVRSACSGVDLVIYLAGHYDPLHAVQPADELLPALRRMLAVNLAGALEVVGHVAPYLAARAGRGKGAAPCAAANDAVGPALPRDASERADEHRRAGGIALVASVAGYRGLPLALGYGPTKAALIHLAEGLHLDLAPSGIGVWLINPGFVATRLTAGNAFTMPALLTPAEAAEAIVAGLASGRFEIHFPPRFTRLLKLVGLLPARLYLPLVRRLTRTGQP